MSFHNLKFYLFCIILILLGAIAPFPAVQGTGTRVLMILGGIVAIVGNYFFEKWYTAWCDKKEAERASEDQEP